MMYLGEPVQLDDLLFKLLHIRLGRDVNRLPDHVFGDVEHLLHARA